MNGEEKKKRNEGGRGNEWGNVFVVDGMSP